MTRHRALPAALFLLAASVAACSGSREAADTRERAYRANNVGVAQLERFSYPEAADAFRQALQIDRTLAMAHINLSLALLYTQDLAGAAREASEGARLQPDAPQPPFILGLIARAENRTSDARREFERVRQIDANDVGTNVNLGQMYLEEQKYPEAIDVLRQAVGAEPYNVSAAYNLGLALTRGGQTAEGQAELQRAQALRSTGYAVTYATGYLEQGHYAEAVASTGAEPDLLDQAVPPVSFTPTMIGSAATSTTVDGRPVSPFGRGFTAADLAGDGARAIATGLGGGLALIDIDSDGDLDLFVAAREGQFLFRNDGRAGFVDVTHEAGLDAVPVGAVPVGCVGGDFDNDGKADLFVLRSGGSTLYRNAGGRFVDVTAAAGLPAYPFLPGAAAMSDVDHDGDLDLIVAGLADISGSARSAGGRTLVFPRDFAPAPLQLLRNNGNGTFTDTTAAAHLLAMTHAVAIVPTDFDNRRDIDLLVVNQDAPPLLFQNRRDGTFLDVATVVGLTAAVGAVGAGQEITGVATADVNKDDFPDVLFARASGGVVAMSNGRGRFTPAAAPAGLGADRAAQFVDYDNDGVLDLVGWSADGPKVFRNLGRQWRDVTPTAVPRPTGAVVAPLSPRGLALADLDGDGATDGVTAGAGVFTLWRNTATVASRYASQPVVLRGRVSNRLGIGAKVQMRAGSLSARLETSATTPPVAPSDVVFGLGRRSTVDTVRVLWPSGTLQAEALSSTPTASVPAGTSARSIGPFVVEELDRKPSSCPFLFTWNGERFEFVTDFMGGGEMGYWESPGVRNRPDPLEYVRISGDQLRPKDGRFELRVTNELEETLFADRLQLVSLVHPRDVALYPNEGMTESPKPFKVFAVAKERVPRATDDHGHDVTERIGAVDRRYPDDFALERFRGYAAPHALLLDLAPVGSAPVLVLTGWTDYAFSSDNVAAQQAGLALTLPALQVKDTSGRWRTEIADIGIPVGRPQAIPIDLAEHLRPGEHDVRIVTNMRIYWDRAVVGTAVARPRLQTLTLDPLTATLHERGFSAEVRPDGQDPPAYDYARVAPASSWKVMPGRYTRPGDVAPLLASTDDMFVIAKPGDAIDLAFDASVVPTLPDGWTRTFLLLADGFSKEMDINSSNPDGVEPLPFHRMTAYPYPASEHYPETPAHQRYRQTYNTRVVTRTTPSLDSAGSR